MSVEPYQRGLVGFEDLAKTKKRRVVGELVAVCADKGEKSEMDLMFPMTRCLSVHQIHELLMTDEQDAGPGKTVNSDACIGFFEVKIGGLIQVGDKVSIGGKVVGEIAGFNKRHMPNHMNIVIKAKKKYSGTELGLKIGDEVII